MYKTIDLASMVLDIIQPMLLRFPKNPSNSRRSPASALPKEVDFDDGIFLCVLQNFQEHLFLQSMIWLAVFCKKMREHFPGFYSDQSMSPVKTATHLLPVTAPAAVRHAA